MSLLEDLIKQKSKLKPSETVITYPDGQCLIESRAMTLPIKTERKPYGFIVDNKPDDKPAKILDHLYLGSQDCCSGEILQNYEISSVLSIGVEAHFRHPRIEYCFMECLDLPETNVWSVIEKSAEVIKNSVKNCENILVHCNAGISRSPSVIIGYLMLEHDYNFFDAFEHVRLARSVIKPNDGFLNQLKNYHPYI